jgi:predicted nucleotide-binding protein (sugar kinase/HSP70/actin superfamily)
MERLAGCERVLPIEQAVKVSLNGEIYVRRDGFSRQNLVERLAAQGIVVRTAPVAEWLYYVDYCLGRGLAYRQTLVDRLLAHPRSLIMGRMERAVKARLRRSGFYDGHELDVGHLMRQGARLVHPRLLGEAILTVASTLSEIGDATHGVLSIGPFGCMPSRLAEAILTYRLSDEKAAFSHDNEAFWKACQGQLALPFLAIESDGNAFSQVVEARLETFILSVKRFKMELDRLHCLPRTDLSPSTA